MRILRMMPCCIPPVEAAGGILYPRRVHFYSGVGIECWKWIYSSSNTCGTCSSTLGTEMG
jgi:hypothetical protein